MNDLVSADLFNIVPSKNLPCYRLPFGIHQNVCSSLAGNWRELAANKLLGIVHDKVNWLDSTNNGDGERCTSGLLEHLWVDKQITLGELLAVLKPKEVQLADRLSDYLKGLIPEEECERSASACRLTDDPRKPVSCRAVHSLQSNFYCTDLVIVCWVV